MQLNSVKHTLVNFFIGPKLKLHLKTCDMLVACSYQYQIGFQNGLLSAKVTEPPVLEPWRELSEKWRLLSTKSGDSGKDMGVLFIRAFNHCLSISTSLEKDKSIKIFHLIYSTHDLIFEVKNTYVSCNSCKARHDSTQSLELAKAQEGVCQQW